MMMTPKENDYTGFAMIVWAFLRIVLIVVYLNTKHTIDYAQPYYIKCKVKC